LSFEWAPGEQPPILEPHSEAKLRVLRAYLHAYCDTLNLRFQRDEFRLDLVDGFCGGGTYREIDGSIVSGSPLIMLEEMQAADQRLNQNRRKALSVDYQCYFVDKERPHIEHLRDVLSERGYGSEDDRILVREGRFEAECGAIIESILRRQPRAGRAIFLLDQTGYSQVDLDLIRGIFRQLPAAEVILTYAADALINFLAGRPEVLVRLEGLGLDRAQALDLIEHKQRGQHALIQRTLKDLILSATGATYYTPFFIRPVVSRRALWFVHLSKHPTARDVMLQLHWELSNTFEHYGNGGLGMLGWDAMKDLDALDLFNFTAEDEEAVRLDLMESLPRELDAAVSKEPVPVGAVYRQVANQTAATRSQLDKVILQLFREREYDIRDKNNRRRTRRILRLQPTDHILLPDNLTLPFRAK